MHVDVPTLYYLIVGTTFVASCLTFWERRFNPPHRTDLGLWALGYLLISVGCLIRIADPSLPAILTIGLSNAAVGWGYAVIALGTVRFVGLRVPRGGSTGVATLTIAWLAGGYALEMGPRIILTSAVNAFFCAIGAAVLLWRRRGVRPLPSQSLAGALFGAHGTFFLLRVLATGANPGSEIAFLGTNITLTMFEGILWSAAAPMTLLVLAREKTESRLVAVSHTDYLTGLDNRRAFFDKGERLLARTVRNGAEAVLLAFDLDHFKTINDRFGHAAGDEVLRLFADVTRAIVGPDAVLARLGGEEFAALLPGRDVDAAHDLAARITREFSARAADAEWLGVPVTVSIGLAESRHDGETLSALLSAADLALYRAKALGRNRIEWARLAVPSVVATA